MKTTASESNDAKFLKLLQGGWITKVPESARPPDTVPVPDRRSNIEEPFNIAALREMGGLRFAEAQIRNRVRIAAGSSGLPRFPKGTDFGILAQSEASQSTRQDRSEKVHDLKIKDLSALGLDPQVLAEVARFDPEARVDDLAVASANLGLYADAKLVRNIAEVRAGDLLQVLRIVDQEVINVRTSQTAANASPSDRGQVGFLKQRPVDSGRVAVRFSAVVGLSGSVRYDAQVVDSILGSSVVTDMQVRFPSKDKLQGYARALIAAERFAPTSPIGDRTVRRFVPSILPSSNEKEQVDDTVWVIMTLLPLARDIRLRLPSSSGASVRPEDAFDLAHFAEQNVPVAVKGAEPLSPECVTAAAESLRSTKRKVTAYVQFMLDAQRSDSELIRSVLNAGGFYTPAAERLIVIASANEVRVCADQNKSAAILARELLEKCKFGTFTLREIAACRKMIPRDTVEIQLGATKTSN